MQPYNDIKSLITSVVVVVLSKRPLVAENTFHAFTNSFLTYFCVDLSEKIHCNNKHTATVNDLNLVLCSPYPNLKHPA